MHKVLGEEMVGGNGIVCDTEGGGHSRPKSWCRVPYLYRSMKMDKSMSKIITGLLGPLRGNLKKNKNSIFKDIVQIGGKEVNPILKD